MGVRRFSNYNSIDTTVVTTAETIVATVTGVSTNQANQVVAIHGRLTITLGAGSTGVTLRFRPVDLTGAQIGEGNPEQITTAAGSTEEHELYREVTAPGEFSGQTYVLTVQVAGATANSTVLNAEIDVEVSP